MKRKQWTEQEVNFLITNYSNLRNDELCKLLNITDSSLENKAYKLKLKKSKEHKSKMIGKRNKMVGRDLSYEVLKNIALKYKTRGEFQQQDSSAYTCARIARCLDDICSHMFKNQYSMPQLILSEILKIIIRENMVYDSRKIIKPYELDIYIPKYNLAFEYDGKGWHQNNKNDEIKNDLCITKNIKLIRIIENNRRYSEDIKNQLIDKLEEINSHCSLNIQKEDILNIDIQQIYDNINGDLINVEDVKNIILKYDNYSIFKKNEPKLYSKLLRTKRLKEFTNDLERNTIFWDEEKIKEELSKYEYLLDFIKNSFACYSHIKKNKLDCMLYGLKRNNNVWDIDKIKKIIIEHNINKISKLKRLYPGSITFLKKHNLLQDIKNYLKDI